MYVHTHVHCIMIVMSTLDHAEGREVAWERMWARLVRAEKGKQKRERGQNKPDTFSYRTQCLHPNNTCIINTQGGLTSARP